MHVNIHTHMTHSPVCGTDSAPVSKKRGAGEQEVLNAKGATDRLLTWLSLFAQFRNPRGLHQTERVHATFTRYVRLFGDSVCVCVCARAQG